MSITEQWEGFVSTGTSGWVPVKRLPKKALRGDLHTLVSGRFEDGSATIQIYWCERAGDGTPGNHASWTPFQLGANQPQQRE